MSTATERKQARDRLAEFSLMTLKEFADLLGVSRGAAEKLLKGGRCPYVNVGSGSQTYIRVDPIDAAIFLEAERERVTFDEFVERHGAEAVTRARKYFDRVERFVA